MADKIVRIGGASGTALDSGIAVPQLLQVEGLDYLIFDYLAEGSMGHFGRMQVVDPAGGFSPQFVDDQVGPYLRELKRKKIRIVTNAGALNPKKLAEQLEKEAAAQGVALSVGIVDGDDLRPRLDDLRAGVIKEMFTGAPFPAAVLTVNAYFGAFPIADALARGADVVITGRVVDSALALGPLIHEFGWKATDYDLLARGTVVGHLLECGAQLTGGTFTDWRDVPDWAHIGFPVGECREDGSCIVTKPCGTGGLVSIGTVAEQMLYEVSDPQAYFVPDVVVDFTTCMLEQVGPDRVRISGATGYPPTSTYKVSVTYHDGWRNTAMQPIIGVDAAERAQRQAAALLERSRELLRARNLPDWKLTHTEILGTEAGYGSRARDWSANREVILKLVVEHDDRQAIDIFWREQNSAILTMGVGTTIGFGGLPTPITQHYSFLLPKTEVEPVVTVAGIAKVIQGPSERCYDAGKVVRPSVPSPLPHEAAGDITIPLSTLAWARSGEKGDLFNVGVIARRPEYLPYLRAAMSIEAVAEWYKHFLDAVAGRVDRYEVPGINALNFVVHGSMAGGVTKSPRLDHGGKGMAQQLLEFPITVSSSLVQPR